MSVKVRTGEYEADAGKTGLNLVVINCPLQNVFRKNTRNDNQGECPKAMETKKFEFYS